MNDQQIIDVHCHLFNGGYALAELTAASWNLLKGTYPRSTSGSVSRSRSFATLAGIADFAAYVARLLDVTLSDCEGNYQNQLESLAHSAMANRGSFLTVPLMMDIYYTLDDNRPIDERSLKELKPGEPVNAFRLAPEEEVVFEQHLENVRNLVANELTKLSKKRAPSRLGSGDPTKSLDQEIKKVRQLFLEPKKRTKRGYEGIELSPGYRDHLQELEELTKKYPGQVFPFLAVDPRRRGIQELMEHKIDQGHGLFKGVKLYPPQGYLPTHPKLEAVYAYCAQYDIPITVHCSLGGFGNLRQKNWIESWQTAPHWETFTKAQKTKSQYYADPENWVPVLERWNNLRINFGHFGGSKAKEAGTVNQTWLDTILRLMKNYPNVYADLSYIADPERTAETMEIIAQNEILKQRVMFGTDFIMMALDRKLGGLTQYFTNYADLSDELLFKNARRFLKLDDS